MKKTHVLVAGIGLLLFAGCAESPRHDRVQTWSGIRQHRAPVTNIQLAPLRVHVTGFVTRNPSSGEFAFTDLTGDTVLGGSSKGIPFPPWTTIATSSSLVKIHVEQFFDGKAYSYDALIGPNPGSGETAVAWVEPSPPTVHLTSGFVYFDGRWPVSEAHLVSAIADGTQMIMRVVPPATNKIVRGYLMGGSASSKVTVKHKTSGDEKPITSTRRYCEVDAAGNVANSQPVPNNDPFEKHVKLAKAAAGMP